jgi:hypothetical protein
LGISFTKQRQKLYDNPRFSCDLIVTTGADGKQYKMLCIPVKRVAVWLWSISSKKVKPTIAPMLEQFQDELQEIIESYFYRGITPKTIEAMNETIKSLQRQLARCLENSDRLERRLEAAERARKHSGTAAAHLMLERRELKKFGNN